MTGQNKEQQTVKTYKGAGLRPRNNPQPGHRRYKWKVIRWSILLFVNFLFFASFYFDIQILEGTLSGSRFLGFHQIDPLAAIQLILASKIIMVNLVIGTLTVCIVYLILGGRSFCSWICPYHWLAEQTEKLHLFLKRKKIIKSHNFDRKIRYYFYVIFLFFAWLTGYTVFETINPVGIISRAIVYGPSFMLLWVFLLLVFEVFYSRRGWCRYFCPMGVSYQLIGMLSFLKVKWDKKKCSNCKRCQSVCMVPSVLTDCVNTGKSEYVDSSLCTRCGMCVDICDDEALGYSFKYLDKLI